MSSPPPSPPTDPLGISEELTPLPSRKTAGDTRLDFDGQLAQPLKVHEDVRTGCGGQTWPAGLVLGKHLLRYHRDELHDTRILELGAGGGLVGLAVAQACRLGTKLLLTDQLEMLELMKHNIVLNELQDRVEALILNWGEPLPEVVVEQKPNVIIAAECVYFEPAFPLLMQTLRDLFELNQEAVVYFCFKKRRRADMHFVKMSKKAFLVEELFDEDRPVFQRQSLFLFSFRSRASERAKMQKIKS
ncbi:putative methyltransferase-domain-containing protein [Stachybotrys elegans]|uniref:Protein-lysine N-methyltransferase EFM6 n=1 Tax=Stachybotrys elegans TaxID=80388 RepID=A0A8K0SY58_9HYPO|nr:putative methyltransferase-domain-containing protein [Stachybotrys elegans]